MALNRADMCFPDPKLMLFSTAYARKAESVAITDWVKGELVHFRISVLRLRHDTAVAGVAAGKDLVTTSGMDTARARQKLPAYSLESSP